MVIITSSFFEPNHRAQTSSGAHPTSHPMDSKGSFPGGKSAECDADTSPPPSAEVKNAWSYTSTPIKRLHGVVLALSNVCIHGVVLS